MRDIKIFVSHRIDINSELIDNPIYVPVRCGAVFDKENPMNIAGDDTGDNISERRMSFSEFTVQYWAWKNIEADYYGLCHYRRYLSFSKNRFRTNRQNMIDCAVTTPGAKKRFGLLDKKYMTELIGQFDIITSEQADTTAFPSTISKPKTVREMWEGFDGLFFDKSIIDIVLSIVDELAPEYSASAKEYFAGTKFRGYNCYVMSRDLFFRMCEFQFSILFELERRLESAERAIGYAGEMLYGIYLHHMSTREKLRIKELQLIFFFEAAHRDNSLGRGKQYVHAILRRGLQKAGLVLFPRGSARRRWVKAFVQKAVPQKH